MQLSAKSLSSIPNRTRKVSHCFVQMCIRADPVSVAERATEDTGMKQLLRCEVRVHAEYLISSGMV